MSAQQVKEIVHRRTIPNADDDSVLDKLEYVCLVYMQRVLDWFNGEGKVFIPKFGFFKLYYHWLHDMMSNFPPLDSDTTKVDAELEAARKRISTSESGDITVQMVDRIGQNLTMIFTKEIEPLQVMLKDDLLYTFYRGAFGTSFNSNVAEYVGLIADKKPGLSILEIGAGTGGTTFHVLERLRNEDETSKAQKYVFTDISPGFLAKAADRFSKDASIMQFTTLNIEDHPTAQGFQENTFDLVVCANVLHAAKSISETLAHCHSLLKPGGKLVLSEVTIKRIFCGFIMGPLPGWWLGEDDGRKGGPLLDVEEWDSALKRADFTGVELNIRGDCDMSKEPVSLLVSTKPIVSRPKPATEIAIIGTCSTSIAALSSNIQKIFESHGLKPSLLQWDTFEESDVADKYCVCLAELQDPILAQINEGNWETFRRLLLRSQGALWVTAGAAMDCPNPFGSLTVGFGRLDKSHTKREC
jgi:SAM-dependent methyltransferase